MAFTADFLKNPDGSTHDYARGVEGNMRVHRGTYETTALDTGGEILTGLSQVVAVRFQPTGMAAVTAFPTIDEVLPKSGGDITVDVGTLATGYWEAIGK